MNAPEIRLPPHSVEAEQSLLGGLLIGGEAAWDRIGDLVAEGDFYRDDHRRIFRHVRRLAETGQPVDVVTIFESIEQSNEADQTGGIAYLGDIANNTPSAANIAGYARTVVERSRLRSLIAVADEIQALAFAAGSAPAQDRIDEATGKLLALAEHGKAKDEPREIGAIIGSVIDAIERRKDRGGEISGLPTGFADLDRLLDGLKGGDLIIVAGRPSMGKTAFALNVAENVALAGKPALVFSMEMGDTQLVTRSLSSIGGINGKVLASGRMGDDEWDKVTAALGRLHSAPLVIDQSLNLSVAQMRARARRQKRKGGLGLVVIDYLQLMRGQGNTRTEELGDITRSLKLMARDLDCPVICLSQLSRKVEERADKRPMLSDLRESGSIEQDADVVLMLYRDEYYSPSSPERGLAEVLIRKNRMGECGDLRLIFQPEFSRFRDADLAIVTEARRRVAEASKPSKARRGFEA
jgi:replicative DNA helicase